LGGDAGDVGTVIVFVAGVAVVVGEVVIIDNFIGNAIIISIGTKEGMIEIDSSIDDYGTVTLSFDVSKTRICPEVIKVN
jgi:hypothetical protein